MIYIQLLLSFIQIGLLSIGGGYAALPIIQEQVVHLHHWISMKEFADILTISQMTPGPIAINAATFVGTKIAGFPGALMATIGVVFPSFIIVLTLSFIYYKYRKLNAIQAILKGLRPAVVALIASAGLSLITQAFWPETTISFQTLNGVSVGLFLVALFLLRIKKWGPIQSMLICAILSVVLGYAGLIVL